MCRAIGNRAEQTYRVAHDGKMMRATSTAERPVFYDPLRNRFGEMDKLQGGDWNSFFNQFEAVASQSPANVSRPSIVDDNVPLPIIRGHQFDIAYQDTVDEHVKCQVCGMLLRRTMFGAHVRQRHPELIPPSLSTDDDSGRHSGLESPDISRNSNFPFSPKLMSPPVAKEPIKLTISLKGHRKHKRRKTKRERRGEDALVTSIEEEQHSPSTKEVNNEERSFWPDVDKPGPSTQRSTPSFLDHRASPSACVKRTESLESVEDVITRISPRIHARTELEDSSDENSKKKRKRKSRRKPRKKEHDRHDIAASTSAMRSRVLPAVEPLRLVITPEGARVIGKDGESSVDHHPPQITCRVASQTERTRPETRSFTSSQQTATRSAFTDLIQSFPATSHVLPTAQPIPHFISQPTTSRASYETANEEVEKITVGQPSKRAERSEAMETLFRESSPVATVLTPSSWVYSQSQIVTNSPILPTYNTRSVHKDTVESGSFRAEAVPFDPFIKPSAILEPEAAKSIIAENTLSEHEVVDSGLNENRRPILPQRKTRQPSGSQESWEPLGIKSPTYGVVLPVAPRQDNDADDATVAFLTSSPELLSEDDTQVKEEVEDVQNALGMSPSKLLRQKFRTTASATSESTDTDYRTIIDVDEDQAELRSSDRDGEIQSLTSRLAALAQEPTEGQKASLEQELESALVVKGNVSDVIDVASTRSQEPAQETTFLLENEPLVPEGRQSRGVIVFTPETQYIPVLDGTFDDLCKSGHLAEYRGSDLTGEVLAHSAVDQSILERDYEETLLEGEELVPSQRLAAEARTLSIESERSEKPIGVLVSARRDETVKEKEAEISMYQNSVLTPHDKMLKYRQEEELSSYEEDYSADDDELVDLHESSVSNYHESEQQSHYEQMLRQRTLSSVTPIEGPACLKNLSQTEVMRQSMILKESAQTPLWLPSSSHQIQPKPHELRVQTAFEGLSQVEVHHSEPILQRLSVQRPSIPSSFQYRVSSLPQRSQQPPPHSFPLHRDHGQKVEISQWSIPQPNPLQATQAVSYQTTQSVPYKAEEQQAVVYSQPQLSQFTYQQTQFQPYKRQPAVSIPSMQIQVSHVPSVSHHHGYGQPIQQEFRTQKQQYGSNMQERRPSELLEEEMRAMRYVYIMNEQRHAKKILAERDKKLANKTDLRSNLMHLTDLPPVIIEPTVIPEGVSRRRMQEHILPPYHYAQYVAKNGPSVSPYKSEADDDSSEDELRKLFDVLDLLQLEPPVPRPRIPVDAQISPHRAQNVRYQNMFEESQRQQYPSGSSHHSGPLSIADAPQKTCIQAPMPSAFPFSSNQPTEPIKIVIPETIGTNVMFQKSASASGEESELSVEEGLIRKHEEGSQRESSDDSTDTEGLRRQWDLSPSVSPLTLEALASGLSSPEGSDSNDGQSGMPVWPTISRKHAKLAIAACRNMPKRFQPLCRRFAWQQGITYLLENFCLKKWEIRPEHDNESVWFFERNVRRFKPFELEPWQITEGSPEDENDFYGFNICADIPVQKCSKTIRLEDRATISFTCCGTPGIVELSSTDDEGYSDDETDCASTVCYDIENIAPSSLKLIPSAGDDGEKKVVVESSEEEETDEELDEDEEELISAQQHKEAAAVSVSQRRLPQKLSYEKQEFIARSCCKQFLQQMVLRKKGECFRTAGKSAVDVKVLLSDLYQECRDAYELMIADTVELPTPDQREIPFSDDAEWVASRILAINRAQNRLLVPSFPPWTVMQRMWKVYGPLRQAAAAIGGDYEEFLNECVNVAYNQYYRLKNGIKVADEIPGDLLDLCYAITCERMREHRENVEALKKKPRQEPRKTKKWLTLKPRERPPSVPSQRTANANLLSRCRRVYDEKRQTKRRRWNTMRYLHNALPGCVIEGIDVFDMAQRTNLSVAGMFGPEHKVTLSEMPFASDMDNRPAYLDMEELLELMDHTLALQSGTTIDQEGKPQPSIDFLTVRGLHFKVVTGERGRCHLMVSPSAIPVPPVTIDRYGNMTCIQRAAVPSTLYPELVSRKIRGHNSEQFCRTVESPVQDDDQFMPPSADNCPACLHTTEDYADMDFAQTCLNGLPQDLVEEVDEIEIDTENTTYRSPRDFQKLMSNEELIKLL